MMKSIEEANIKEGVRVLVRVDWNVPVNENGEILDDFRIKQSLDTIKYLVERRTKISGTRRKKILTTT